MRFNTARLRLFVEAAMTANVSYFASRRELFGFFVAAIDRFGTVEISDQYFLTIRTFLSSRDVRPSDQARLAYEVAILKIYELLPPVGIAPMTGAPAGPSYEG